MQVMCIKGHEGLLEDGNIYNVVEVTQKGNYLLEEVSVPEGYTSFAKERFEFINDIDWRDDLYAEMEESFWAEQTQTEYTT